MRIRRFTCFIAGMLACMPLRSAPGSGAIAWLPAVEIASGGGAMGPWLQNDSRYDYVDDATAAFLPDGALALAWVDQGRKEVLLQVLEPGKPLQAAPSDVSRSPATFSWMPRIAAGGPGTLYLLWQEIIFSGGSHGGDILFARSTDGGITFSPPRNLSASRGGDGKGRLGRAAWSNGSLDIAAGPDGSVLAAWTEYDGALWLARSRDGGVSFTAPQQIAGDGVRPARGPSLAIGPAGTVYLAWTVGEDADADVRVSRSDDGGASFGAPVLVGAKGARADMPALGVDHAGEVHLVYMEQAHKRPSMIRYLRSGSAALRFGPPRTLSAPGERATAPHLAIDGLGRVHVAWTPASGRGLQHVMVSGGGFTRPAAVVGSTSAGGGSDGSQQGILGKKLAAGPNGALAVVNSSLVPGSGSRVWLVPGRVDISLGK